MPIQIYVYAYQLCFFIQVEEFIASIKSYQSLIVEKDGKIAEFKIKLEDLSSNQREKELFEELAVYKAKNNVSVKTDHKSS